MGWVINAMIWTFCFQESCVGYRKLEITCFTIHYRSLSNFWKGISLINFWRHVIYGPISSSDMVICE